MPHHGPIIQAPDAAGKAVSVRWTGHEDYTDDLKAFLGLNTAANVDEAMAALSNYATGAQNFVLADDTGHIAYDPHALVPVRPWATGAAMAAGTPTPHPPWFPLPGDGSAEWGPTGNTDCAGAGARHPGPPAGSPTPSCRRAQDPGDGLLRHRQRRPGRHLGQPVPHPHRRQRQLPELLLGRLHRLPPRPHHRAAAGG